ncbi:hypothetical protein HY095_02815 [Candidatus Micrarchaeota archaeon]|nr:hypothetical protein [Candidatus Micrarchaeota archaeon]
MAYDSGKMETKELVESLEKDGLDLDLQVPKTLMARPDAVPLLKNTVEFNYDCGDGFAIIHAVHVLGAIKTPESFDALLYALVNRQEALGDWPVECMPSLLAGFGPPALPKLKQAASFRLLDEFARVDAMAAITAIAWRHPEAREECVEFLKLALENEDDPYVVGEAVNGLCELHETSALPAVTKAFDEKRTEFNQADQKEALETMAGKPIGAGGPQDDFQRAENYFTEENFRRLREISEESDEDGEAEEDSAESTKELYVSMALGLRESHDARREYFKGKTPESVSEIKREIEEFTEWYNSERKLKTVGLAPKEIEEGKISREEKEEREKNHPWSKAYGLIYEAIGLLNTDTAEGDHEGKALIEQALELDPDNEKALSIKADLLSSRQDRKALPLLDKLIELGEAGSHEYAMKAQFLVLDSGLQSRSKIREALGYAETACGMDSENFDAVILLAQIKYWLYDGSYKQLLEQARQIDAPRTENFMKNPWIRERNFR